MNLTEMFAKMKSGEVQAHSELGTRDESKQNRNFGTRIQKMKTVTGINARVLVMKDVVIPFNPFTGKADDNYNKKTPFRPILLVSQTIAGIKSACADSPELSDIWTEILGKPFSPGEEATMDDYMAFKACEFIKPRVMTYHTVALNFGQIYGFSEFRTKYTVDPTMLNEQGTYDYGDKAPLWHQGAIFFNSMLRPEVEEIVKQLNANGANKEQIATARRNVFAKSPIGFVGPSNLLPFFFFPYTDAPKSYDVSKFKDIEQDMRFYSYTDKWTVPVKEAMDNPMYDTDMDFFDFTLKTAAAGTTKPNGQVITDNDSMELYSSMTISNTDGRLALHGGKTYVGGQEYNNDEAYKSFFDVARAYFLDSQNQSTDGGETFERIMAASNRFRPIDTVMDNFLPACNEVFTRDFAGSKYYTDAIRNQNAAFLTAMNPANAIALAGVDEEDLAAAHESARKSTAELISMAREGTDGDTDPTGVGGLETMDIVDG